MAVTITPVGSSLTLSKCLQVFALSLKLDGGFFSKLYKILVLFLTVVLYLSGLYLKLEDCALQTVILRYLDLLLTQIRFMLNVTDVILPFVARESLLELTELLDSSKTSHKKTIFLHSILNYFFITVQILFYVVSMCLSHIFCTSYCLIPNITAHSLMTAGFFRSFCVLFLLKQRIFEVSEDLGKKLKRVSVADSVSVNVKQLDEVLTGIHAYGRCFGIQLALQFVDFECLVVQNVVMLKKVTMDFSVIVYVFMVQRILISAFYCVLMIVLSGKIAQEFKKMGRRCSDMLVLTKKYEPDYGLLQKELRLLLEQIKYRQTRISAFGFYDITYSTLLKMLGYMSTYIIVALQFPSSS